MSKWLLAFILALTLPLSAQSYVFNLKLAVAGSAVGFANATSPTCTTNSCINAGSGHPQATSAVCTTTAASGTIAYRVDGTTVTSSTGIEVAPGSTFVIQGTPFLLAFSAIRTSSTSGDVRCVLSGS